MAVLFNMSYGSQCWLPGDLLHWWLLDGMLLSPNARVGETIGQNVEERSVS